MNVRLYNIPGSHPAMAVQLMLQHKGIPYKRTDLFPVACQRHRQGAAASPATRSRR